MRFKLVQYKENVYASFWVVPLLMSILAIALAIFTLAIDHSPNLQIAKQFLNNFIGAQSARTTLSIIATAVITITSVTFSITVLTLSTTSNQLGSRLLPNFMRQQSTQVVLGLFIGTFIYALIVLHAMSMFNPFANLPYLSVTVGLILGIICFFALIYFIHFVCHVIQIDNVLTFLTEDLIATIQRQFPNNDKNNQPIQKIVTKDAEAKFENERYQGKTLIRSEDWGYLQTIDYNKLVKIATQHSLLIKVPYHAGKFTFKKLPILTILHNDPISQGIQANCLSAFQIGKRRSTTQDVEFAFEEIGEIAIRALSTGVNDPYTAIHCFDRMIQGFVVLAEKSMLPRVVCDKQDEVRLIRQVVSYQSIVETALNRFRQQAKLDLSVTIHMLKMIERLITIELPEQLKAALLQQARSIYQDVDKTKLNEQDKKDLEQAKF